MPAQKPQSLDEARAMGWTVVKNTNGTWTATKPVTVSPQETGGTFTATPPVTGRPQETGGTLTANEYVTVRPQETDGGRTQLPGSPPVPAVGPRPVPTQTSPPPRREQLAGPSRDWFPDTRSLGQPFNQAPGDPSRPRSTGIQRGFSFSAEGPMAYFNRGIIRGSTLGVGTEWLDKASRRMNFAMPKDEPESVANRMAQGAGMAAGTVPLALIAAQGMAARGGTWLGGKYWPEIGRAIRDPFIRTPGKAAAVETASGAGAGLGEAIAGEEYGPIGQILGGGITGMGTAALATVHPLANIPTIFQFAKRNASQGIKRFTDALAPFQKEAAETGAAAQLQKRSADPVRAAARLGEPSEYATPMQQIGETNFYALERSIARRDPATAEKYLEQLRNSQEALSVAAKELGDTGTLEGLVVAARTRADNKIQEFGAGISEEAASNIYYQELLAAQDGARSTQKELWNIPKVRLTMPHLRERYARLNADLAQAQKSDMPTEASTLLTRADPETDALILDEGKEIVVTGALGPLRVFAESESITEVQGFASRMREIARKALSAGDNNRARLAGELGDAAWEDLMNAADVPSSVSSQLQAAKAYTLAYSKAFREGAVGRLLSYAREGGTRVKPTELLEVGLGNRGNAQAAVTSDQLTAAIGFGGHDPIAGSAAIEGYLRQRFFRSSTAPGGTYDANGARIFMRNNAQVLKGYKGLRNRMEEAARDMESAERLSILRKTVSQAMKSNTPLDDLQRGGNLSGSARYRNRSATRAAVVEFSLHPGDAVDEAGHRLVSGTRLLGFLKQPKTSRVFKELFSEAELQKLQTIADELSKIQRASGPLDPTISGEEIPLPAGIARVQGTLKLWSGIGGAKTGAYVGKGGSQLKLSSLGSSVAQKLTAQYLNQHIDEVIVDSMSDEALLKALLLKPDASAQETESALRALSEWVKKSRQEIPSALDRMLVATTIGTGAAMMPDSDQHRMPSRDDVPIITPLVGRIQNRNLPGTMGDILPDQRRIPPRPGSSISPLPG